MNDILKIMLVEDSPGDQELFKEAVKTTGMSATVCVVSSAQEAISQIFALRPDLIVMDIMMPGLSGDDFVDLLQNGPSGTSLFPIVFLTGKQIKDMFDMGFPNEIQINGKNYPLLSKPADALMLKEIISKLVIKR